MTNQKKRLRTRLAIASLGFFAAFAAGIAVPVSCARAQTQSNAPQNPNDPGASGTNPGASPERKSEFAETNALLAQDQRKSWNLFSYYVEALTRDELPVYPDDKNHFDSIPKAPSIAAVPVATRPSEVVTTETFVGELVGMLRNGLSESTSQNARPLSELIAEIEAKKAHIAKTRGINENVSYHSTWNHYFDLANGGAGPMWVYEESINGLVFTKYELYMPTNYITLSFDDAGRPALANDWGSGDRHFSFSHLKARLQATKLGVGSATYEFKSGAKIELPDSLFGGFARYYSQLIENAKVFEAQTQSVIDAYKANVASENLDRNWWNQAMTSIDPDNETRLKADVTQTDSAENQTRASEVMGWIKDNSVGALPEGIQIPATLSSVDSTPSSHPLYYGSPQTAFAFSGTGPDGKTYELRLNVTDFDFDATVNGIFAPGKELLTVAPKVKLGEGSQLLVSQTPPGKNEKPVSIALRSETWIDASRLVDMDAFSNFWTELVLSHQDRNAHHEAVALGDKTDQQRLNSWERYVKLTQQSIQRNILEDKSLLADFVADNIDLALKEEYAAIGSSSNSGGFMFGDASELKAAISDADTAITFPNSLANRNYGEAFAFGANDPANTSGQSTYDGLNVESVNDWLNYAIKIETKNDSSGTNSATSIIFVYFGTQALAETVGATDVSYDSADLLNPNGHITLASGVTSLESIRSTAANAAQTPRDKVEVLSTVPSIVIVDRHTQKAIHQKFWGFIMGNFRKRNEVAVPQGIAVPPTSPEIENATIKVPKGIFA